MRLKAIPAGRGCGAVSLDTKALLGKAPAAVRAQARDDAGDPVQTGLQAGERLVLAPGPAEYVLE